MTATKKDVYRPTTSKYKGGASEMYVTYDLEQKTRGGGNATYPKVKRVYIAGDVKGWHAGQVLKKSGRRVHGIQIEYERTRRRYHRAGYTAEREGTTYDVAPASVGGATQRFSQVVEIPEAARDVQFFTTSTDMPERYRHALQRVR
jgi:hypothetical protein